ncbi:MAG: hypothetical protein Q8M16_20420 [Pirellulaceae bacterium]|nr:hypothetical protein [Pirellulaceae bacterium]
MQYVNLTHASIPLLLDLKNIRQDQVLIANDQLHNCGWCFARCLGPI